jgi:hypothetical protein
LRGHKILSILGSATFLVLFLFLARHTLSPVRDFVLDDWPTLLTVESKSLGELVAWAGRDVFRPVYNAVFYFAFKWLGDDPVAFSVLTFVIQSLLVMTVWWFATQLTNCNRSGWLAAVIFCVIPVTNEVFHFHLTSVVLYVPIFYLLSLGLYRRAIHSAAGKWAFTLPPLLYGLAVFSYEYGVFLCPLYVLLGWPAKSLKTAIGYSLPYWCIAVLYLAWRFTAGFGWGLYTIVDGSYFHNDPISIMALIQHARQILSWWVGGLFWETLATGILGFQTILPKFQIGLVLVNALFLVMIAIRADRLLSLRSSRIHPAFIAFGITLLGYLPFLLHPATSRHNAFPSVGISILGALALAHAGKLLRPGPLCLLLIMMISCQGLAVYWRDNSGLHRHIYNSLAASQSKWVDAELILVDTESLRHRLSSGLGPVAPRIERHGPAVLPRSWVVSTMLAMHYHDISRPLVVMDWESGASWSQGQLRWHQRFNPSQSFATPAERVSVFDLYSQTFTGVAAAPESHSRSQMD